HEGERRQRTALGALAASERRAFRALAEVCAQPSTLLAGEASVQLARDCELGLSAGQRSLELLAERTPCAENQRLDGARREVEDPRDLRVAPPLELAHHECGALVEREMAERTPD